MTTWTFNAVRGLLKEAPKTLWIEPASSEERQFATHEGTVIAKCHHYSELLASSANIIIYSYRDIRASAVSYRRKFSSPCTQFQLDSWVSAGQQWMARAHLVFRYESVLIDPVGAVAQLRSLLEKHGFILAELSDIEVANEVDEKFARSEQAIDGNYDVATMILPQHRTYSPEPEQLSPEDRSLYDRVTAEQATWLHDFGYLKSDSYGQDLEYRLATLLLRTLFESPIVVDVGVERGSFIELALSAGAKKVIGFEPLPRHLSFLKSIFGDDPRVSIHPLAISNKSGRAVLHIATDPEGNELDYHHTLSDLGDSVTVIRSHKTLEVDTATLADLDHEGLFPARIDFLKIDTDGHDLAVLEGLGDSRPGVIMAEYWEHLPESSGDSPYKLSDLEKWARLNRYSKLIVIRRNGRLESVEQDVAYSVAGDWGNVFMIRSDLDRADIAADISRCAEKVHYSSVQYVQGLIIDVEEKEAEIRRLDNALVELRNSNPKSDISIYMDQLEAKEAVIRDLQTAFEGAQNQIAQIRMVLQKKGCELDLYEDVRKSTAVVANLVEQGGPIQEARHVCPFTSDFKSQEVILELQRSLQEKEAVIQELAQAVKQYRAGAGVFSFLLRPASMMRSVVVSFKNRVRNLIAPRLGNLSQYAPRPIHHVPQYVQPKALSDTPRVSIVTPSFNQAHFIGRTIQSVLDQNYPNLEYFVQDGGSQDGTVEVLKEYTDRLAGWESQPDGGQSQAINLGFAHTTGEIMAWLNSDDILLPGTIHTIVDYFNRHPEVDVVYGDRLLIDESDLEIGCWILPGHDSKVLSWADYVPQESLFWRRRIWDRVGGRIDESFKFAMDWDLLVRFRDAGARFAHIPRFLGAFRIHEHQKTSAAINEVGHKEMDRIRERVMGRVPGHTEVRKAVIPFLLKHICVHMAWRVKSRLRCKK